MLPGKLSVLRRTLFGGETIFNDLCLLLISWRAGISHPGYDMIYLLTAIGL